MISALCEEGGLGLTFLQSVDDGLRFYSIVDLGFGGFWAFTFFLTAFGLNSSRLVFGSLKLEARGWEAILV